MQKQNNERIIPDVLKGKTYLDPTYDPAFRAFFSNTETLIDFLNSLLNLEPGCKIKKLDFTFANPLEFRVPEPNTVIFDIHAVTEDMRFLDIEMQRAKHSFFIDRVLLYSAYLAIKGKQQMEQSADFLQLDETERKRRRYAIPEIISIWICNFHPTENFEGYRDSWALYSENDLAKGKMVAVSEKIKYILIDLKNFSKQNKKAHSRIEKWLYLLSNAGASKGLPDFDDDLFLNAIERIRVSNANDKLLSEQAKEMVTQDETDVRIADGIILGREQGLAEGRTKGLAEGLAEGRAEGRAEGLAEGHAEGHAKGCVEGELKKAKEMAKSLLENGVSVDVVIKCSGLSKEEIDAL